MKKVALHWKIIIGMVLGVLFGLIASSLGWVNFCNDWIKPWGVIFINLLKLIAVPLILASLIKGVSSLNNISKLSKIGGKTILTYLMTTLISVTFGLVLVNIIQPGLSFSQEKRQELKSQYANSANLKIQSAESVRSEGPLQFLVDIVPENLFKATANNKNMLQVIFFALFFGISMIMLPKEKVKTVKSFFDEVNDIVLQMVDVIMFISPYGVFALLAGLVVDFGASAELFKALGIYSITVISGLILMVVLVYPLILRSFTKLNYFDFFKGIAPAQMLAFSTSSSAATLPVTMERCEEHLGVSEEVSSFVLPLGATINMDGTSLYQSVAAVFIAQAFGYDLDISQQLTIVLTATLASIGSAAVPGSGMVMLVIVLSAIGIDPEGIALIFAVDRLLDMLRTVVNVTGDATVASVVASTEGQLRAVSDKELMS